MQKRIETEFYSKNSDFHLYFGNIVDLQKRYKNYFKFAFIRDPYDRFISNYKMFTQIKSRKILLDILFNENTENIQINDFFL